MNKFNALLIATMSFFSANAFATPVPEIDAGYSVIGLGLLSGLVALLAERARK